MSYIKSGTPVWPVVVSTASFISNPDRWWAQVKVTLTRDVEVKQQAAIPSSKKFSRFNDRPNMYTVVLFNSPILKNINLILGFVVKQSSIFP